MQDTMMDLLYEAAEPSFSDPEDFVDDIGDEELLGDLLQERPLEAEGIACSCVVVDNVPRVGPEKLDRLKKALHKIFSKYGDVVTDFYPEGDDGANKGYVFVEYATPAQAEAAKAADGLKLDKQHTLRVTTLSEFDRVMDVGDDWEPPEEQPFRDTGNLQHWLLDPDCCDQYSVIYEAGQRTAIFSNDAAAEPVPVEERNLWTETYVRWSPRGTYLATFHQRGIALWGGDKFKQIQRFSHPGVSLADFSPCESYVVTCSPDAKEDPQQALVIVWDVKSGQTKRVFHCESSTHWPIFKWSHDGKYLARMTQDTLSIYETPSMFLLDKKSLTIVGIEDFSWSPGDNIVAFWSHGGHDLTAKVTLMQIPSRQDIKSCHLAYDVVDCKLHWQRNGHYLCVKVGRHPKGARRVVASFKIFRMREKVVPVDVLEMKDAVVTFALEPNGSKLAVIHGESPSRYSVSIYHIQEGGSVKLMKVFENQPVNSIFWSPRGQFLVLAGLGSLNGQLVFLDASDCTVMNAAEHYTASDVEWDPTGRYVVTSVSWWSHKVDNAFWLWSFQGRLLRKVGDKERFCQLLWRPRPPALLSAEQQEAIGKNLKSFSKVFEQKDRLSQSRASKELVDRRRAMVEGYERYRQDAARAYRQQRELRLRLRDGMDTDELDSGVGGGDDWEEETVEFFIGEERIPL